ncbi:MAG: hypothetical protein AAFV85_27745, partial [Cyanobacteria bacterium J06634_6]
MELLVLALIGLSAFVSFSAVKMQKELETAKKRLHKYKHLISQEEYQNEMALDLEAMKRQKLQLTKEETHLRTAIESLSKKLTELQEEDYLESFGFYQPKYDFISSGSYESLLKKNRDKQKAMVKKKTAAICHSSWSVSGSEKEGKKMATNFLK